MKLEGTLTYLVVVLAIVGAVWFLSSIADDTEPTTPPTSAESPRGETFPDGYGGFYLLDWANNRLWYVRGDRYQAVGGLEDAWISDLVRTAAGDLYALGEDSVWRLEGATANPVQKGAVPATREEYALPLPDESDPEPSVLHTRDLLPPDPREDRR